MDTCLSAALFWFMIARLFDNRRVQSASRVMKSMIKKGVKENMDMVQKILKALPMRGHVEEAPGRINLMLMNDFALILIAWWSLYEIATSQFWPLSWWTFCLERDCDIAFLSYVRLLDALYTDGRILASYSILCKIKAKGGVVDKKGCEAVTVGLNEQENTKQAEILSRILACKIPVESKKGKKVAIDAY